VDIFDYDVGLLKVGSVCRGSTDFDGFGKRLALQDAALDVEHICESGIEIILKLFGYEKAWRDNKRAASLEGNGVRVMQPDLPQPTGSTISHCPDLHHSTGGSDTASAGAVAAPTADFELAC
jgi:hypothetical protein